MFRPGRVDHIRILRAPSSRLRLLGSSMNRGVPSVTVPVYVTSHAISE